MILRSMAGEGVLASEGRQEARRPPSPKVHPGAFNDQREGWKTPWHCTASVCVAGVHCWEILG